MVAVGYIRQSKRADLDVALSYDTQLAAIRKLAEADGIDPDSVTIYADLGRSGGQGKEHLRPEYQRLLKHLQTGDVDTVYALSMSRLARSTVEFAGFLHRYCGIAMGVVATVKDRDGNDVSEPVPVAPKVVRVRMAKDGFDPTTHGGRFMIKVVSAVYEWERDMAVDRAKENANLRRARGERMGRVPYGERPGDRPDLVLAAWKASSGSLDDTARRLNKEGVPTWQGQRVKPDGTVEKVQWTGPAVRLVLSRLLPGIIPARAKRGVKPTAGFLLYRLLQCPCGRIMTASKDARGNHDVVYRCHAAGTVAEHRRPPHPDGTPGELVPLYRTREALVLPAIKAEAAKLRRDWDAVELSEGAERERADLAAQRVQVMDMFQFRKADAADIQRRLDAIDAAEAALTERTTVIDIPDLDWSQPPAIVNAILGAMWERVELGPDLMPVRFVWRRAEWRSDR